MAISGFLNALEKKIDLYDLYSAARDQALAELAKIAAVDTSGFAPMFERLEGKGDNALAKAAAFDFGMVTTLLTGLLTDCATATHTLDGQKGFDQVMGQIAKIADRDRDDLRMSVEAAQASSLKLDEVIAGFEPDIHRNVITVAFKELFGCDLSLSNAQWVQKPDGSYEKQITDDNGMDRDAPSLRRFHDLMASLPESDTLDNDSFLSFERRGGIQTGSAFNIVS